MGSSSSGAIAAAFLFAAMVAAGGVEQAHFFLTDTDEARGEYYKRWGEGECQRTRRGCNKERSS